MSYAFIAWVFLMCGGAEVVAAEPVAAEAAGKGAADVAGANTITAEELFATQAADDAAMGANAAAGAAGGAAVGAEVGSAEATPVSPAERNWLDTLKTVAPIAGAVASLTGAAVGVAQAKSAQSLAQAAKPAQVPNAPQPANVAIPVPGMQSSIDPDLTVLRKKNALLFGLDSPAATDLTKGAAGTGSLGRTTLLGGTTSLGG